MQKAKDGIASIELMEELDQKIEYGGARKISEYEEELLNQMDEICDYQLKVQKDLNLTKRSLGKTEKQLKQTDSAISTYCTSTTRDKILFARGWQFMPEKVAEIEASKSDKEIIAELSKINEMQERRKR